MASRLELQKNLSEILRSNNVYFQPPSSIQMKYPAIVYSLNVINVASADNNAYKLDHSYMITLISQLPDNEVIDRLLMIPTCRFDRSYLSNNLYHYVFTLYF